MFRQASLVIGGLLCLAAAPLLADEAEDAFNQLYGDDLKRVLATPAPADDIGLAKRLLDAARKAEKQPEFLALLCEKAYDLAGKDASGYPTATAAMDLVAEKVPEKKIEALRKTAALYQKQYATARGDAKTKAGEALIQALSALAAAQAEPGDIDAARASLKQALTIATAIKSDAKATIQAQLEGLAPAQKMEKQIAALKAKVEKDPADAASRKELVRLLLVEEDNPAEAAKFLDESLDEATRKYVPAAAKPLEEAPELACKELGDWYRGLADQAAASASKGAMLRRAQGYYERFLDLHTTEDLARTTASLMLKKIEDALTMLSPAGEGTAPKSSGQWIDLLKLVDVEKHTVTGNWRRTARGLLCEDGRLMIPIMPQGSYELEYKMVPISGPEAGHAILPVGSSSVVLVIGGYDRRLSGLYVVNGKGVDNNASRVATGDLRYGQCYTVGAKVVIDKTDVTITVTLDGKPHLAWKGPCAALSPGGFGVPNRGCVGLATNHGARIAFESVCLRMLSGKAVAPRPADSKALPPGKP